MLDPHVLPVQPECPWEKNSDDSDRASLAAADSDSDSEDAGPERRWARDAYEARALIQLRLGALARPVFQAVGRNRWFSERFADSAGTGRRKEIQRMFANKCDGSEANVREENGGKKKSWSRCSLFLDGKAVFVLYKSWSTVAFALFG